MSSCQLYSYLSSADWVVHQCACQKNPPVPEPEPPTGGSLLPSCSHAHLLKVSYLVACFTLGILCRTLLPWLVFMFSTSHTLAFHSWWFSRLMSRIRRLLLSSFVLYLILSISSVLFAFQAFVLSTVICSKVDRCGGIHLAQTL